jgi:hypothetical protein
VTIEFVNWIEISISRLTACVKQSGQRNMLRNRAVMCYTLSLFVFALKPNQLTLT